MTLQGKTVLVAGRTTELPAALGRGLTAAGAAVRLQSRDGGAAEALVSAVHAELGGIDILVNVIGSISPIAFLDMSRADWGRLLTATFDDAFMWSQAAARAMSCAGKQGAIINIVCECDDSDADIASFARLACRGGVAAFTRALASELADRRIQVNSIVGRTGGGPGSHLRPAFEDLVRTALFLCAAHETFVTGETIDLGRGTLGYEPAHFPA